ncbi:hypothetical protein [Providencia sp. CIM-Carb-044]|nr:hypothetical protein [Providencia sp. CIM-Carb-044]MDX7424279.1 hypothetical protein [Providencia sp. CIM-Carb-044]
MAQQFRRHERHCIPLATQLCTLMEASLHRLVLLAPSYLRMGH